MDLLDGSIYISIDLKNPSKILSGQVQDIFNNYDEMIKKVKEREPF